MKKRIIAIFLFLALVFSLMTTAFAAMGDAANETASPVDAENPLTGAALEQLLSALPEEQNAVDIIDDVNKLIDSSASEFETENSETELFNAAPEEALIEYPYKDIFGSVRDGYSGFTWSDSFLLDDANMLHPDITKAAVVLAMAAYEPQWINPFLSGDNGMGFTILASERYDIQPTLTDNDHVAYTIAQKDVGDYSAYIVAIRGTYGNAEWLSNFNFGSAKLSSHYGFFIAEREVFAVLKSLMQADPKEKVVLVTGHSRGAAVANMLTSDICLDNLASSEHVFGYTYACPAVTLLPNTQMANLYNFNYSSDLISAVPLESWGYGRNGVSITIRNYDSATGTEDLVQIIEGAFPTIDDARSNGARALLTIFACAMMDRYKPSAKEVFALATKFLHDSSSSNSSSFISVEGLLGYAWAAVEKLIPQAADAHSLIGYILNVYHTWHSVEYNNKMDALHRWPNEIVPETEDGALPTEEDYKKAFDNWKSHLSEDEKQMLQEISDFIGKPISSRDDLIKAQVALSSNTNSFERLLGCVYSFSELMLDTSGHPKKSVNDSHCPTTYLSNIQYQFYGYKGHSGSSISSALMPQSMAGFGVNCAVRPMRTLGPYCFENCTNLSSVQLRDSLEYISKNTFYNCSSLQSIEIPDSVESFGAYAFSACSALQSIVVPDSVVSIGASAFSACGSLESISLPFVGSSRTASGTSDAVFGYIFGRSGTTNTNQYYTDNSYASYAIPVSLKHVTISDTQQLSYGAFSNCSNITDITLSEGLKTIGNRAFSGISGYSSLSSVSIPGSVDSIGENAFEYCSKLAEVHITDLNAWFEIDFPNANANPTTYGKNLYLGDELITELEIPDGVTAIKPYALYNCNKLTSVTIPDSVERIGTNTFYGCSSLADVYFDGTPAGWSAIIANINIGLPSGTLVHFAYDGNCGDELLWKLDEDGVLTICGSGEMYDYRRYGEQSPWFDDRSSITSVIIEEGATSIGSHAFFDCENLADIEIPDTVISIGDSAFSDCEKLSEITIPDSVARIGSSAFEECCSLTSIVLPNGIFEIEPNTFSDCEKLVSIVIPDSVSSIGDGAFRGCYILNGVTIPNSVARIGSSAFEECRGLTSIVLPNGISEIEFSTFSGCEKLASIVIPDSVSSIGDGAFRGCYILNDVTIPDSVARIGSSAFEECRGLTSIVLPNGISEIEPHTFSGCYTLASVTVPGSVSSIGDGAFAFCESISDIYYEGTEREWNAVSFEDCDEWLTNAAVHYLKADIKSHPENVSANSGDTATFTVEATGKDLTYQWQISKNNGSTWSNCTAAGCNTASYSFKTQTSFDGRMYRCVVKDANGNSVTSDAAKLTVTTAVAITAQPESQSVTSGSTVTFNIAASGTGLSYQWQVSTNGGSTWSNCTAKGYNTANYSFKTQTTFDGRMYRCIVKSSSGASVTSNAVKLNVAPAVAITAQPESQTVTSGSTVTFNIAASGTGLSYQWQVSTNGGSTWSNCTVTGYNTANYSFKTQTSFDGRMYRCIVKDTNGASITSAPAKLTVTAAGPTITTQPESQTITAGDSVTFNIAASGTGLSYQWQVSTNGGSTWSNCTAKGYNTANYSFKAQTSFDGRMYRCIVKSSSGASVTSNAVKLTVVPAVAITAQPESQTVTAGDTVTFNIAASGTGLSYQWQVSTNGGSTWSNCIAKGYNTANYSFKTQTSFDGRMYRCIVKDANGASVTSNAATLTVNSSVALVITEQPVSVNADLDSTAKFTVTATGSGLSYQWQYKTATGTTWSNSGSAGNKTDTLSVGATTARNGFSFRCVVKDANGASVISNAATLTVDSSIALVITEQPVSVNADLDSAAKFTVAASGDGLSYQWQYKTATGTTWSNSGSTGNKTDTLSVGATAARNGFSFRCVIKDANGASVTSDPVTLTVN